jgi:hypothetical protein
MLQRSFTVTGTVTPAVTLSGGIDALTVSPTGTTFTGTIKISGYIQPQTSGVIPIDLVTEPFSFTAGSGPGFVGGIKVTAGNPKFETVSGSRLTWAQTTATTSISQGSYALYEKVDVSLTGLDAGASITFDAGYAASVSPAVAPEPASGTLAGLGVAPLALLAWRRRFRPV